MPDDRGDSGPSGTVWGEMGRYAHLGMQLALSMGLFLLAGWWLDARTGTTPLFTIVGAMVGAAAGFYSMIRQLTGKPPGGEPGAAQRTREKER